MSQVCNTVMLPVGEYEEMKQKLRIAMDYRKMLEAVRLEKRALLLQMGQLEKRERQLLQWIDEDSLDGDGERHGN